MVTDGDDADHSDVGGDNDDNKIAHDVDEDGDNDEYCDHDYKDHHDLLLLPHFERVPPPAHTPVHCRFVKMSLQTHGLVLCVLIGMMILATFTGAVHKLHSA